MQHCKLVNSWIRGFKFWCQEQVIFEELFSSRIFEFCIYKQSALNSDWLFWKKTINTRGMYLLNIRKFAKVCRAQLIGRIFSPSQKLKKLSHPLTVFWVRFGYTCPPRKILGGVYGASKEHVFHKGPPFRFMSISFILRGTLMKNMFFRSSINTP